MKKKIYLILFFFVFLVVGCSQTQQTHTVIFEDDIKIEYGKNTNSAQFVTRVDSFLVKSSMIEDNKINISNFTVICPDIKSDRLGEIKLTYKINDEIYETKGTVVDTTKPQIQFKESDYTFEVGEMKDIHEYYTVKDNYDPEEDIKVTIDGIDKLDINKAGTYELKFTLKDSSGNKTEEELTITIKDSEEEKRKQEEAQKKEQENNSQSSQSNNQQNSSNSNSTYNPPAQNTEPSAPVQRPSYSSKDYMFSQGYDMTTAPAACQADLVASGVSGNCTPIQNEEGIYIGMRLTLY